MFNNLSNFSYKRNFKEAVGFYIYYLIYILIFAVFITVVTEIIFQFPAEKSFEVGLNIGILSSVFITIILSYLILSKKKLLNFNNILFILLSGIFSFFGGDVLGLTIVAFLTTRSSHIIDKSE